MSKLMEKLEFGSVKAKPVTEKISFDGAKSIAIVETRRIKGRRKTNESIRAIAAKIMASKSTKWKKYEEIDSFNDLEPKDFTVDAPDDGAGEVGQGAVASNTPGIEGKNADNVTDGDSPLAGAGADSSVEVLPAGKAAPCGDEGDRGAPEESEVGVAEALRRKKNPIVEKNLVVSVGGGTDPQTLQTLAQSLHIEGNFDQGEALFIFRDVSDDQISDIEKWMYPDSQVTITEDLETPDWDDPDEGVEDVEDPDDLATSGDEPIGAPPAATDPLAPPTAPIAPAVPPATNKATVALVTNKALDLLADLAKAGANALGESAATDPRIGVFTAADEVPGVEKDAKAPNLEGKATESFQRRPSALGRMWG